MPNSLYYLTQEMTDQYSELDHMVYKIFYHAAATLSGVKPATLISFRDNHQFNFKEMWFKHKEAILASISLDAIELKNCINSVKVLFYNHSWLDKIISNKKASSYLSQFGYYSNITVTDALKILHDRFRNHCPDEIGVFLGYPLSDVIAFSSDYKDCSIGVGYWKVYSNLSEARQTFELYDLKRLEFTNILKQGTRPYDLLKAI